MLDTPLRKAVAVAAAVAMLSLAWPQPLLTAQLPTTIALKEMTWVEVRTAIQAGFTTIIVPTGGIEQNGPHMILGKHDVIVAEAAGTIARSVGKTLVAPVVSFVPQGDYDPPSGHLLFPGTIGVPEPVFAATLEGIARSLKAGGFKTILFIGDHGTSQAPQKAVAASLSAQWASAGVRVVSIDAYYDDKAQVQRLLSEGQSLKAIGQHASIIDSSELMSITPKGVDLARYRAVSFGSEPTGVTGDPTSATAERGKALLAMRIEAATAAIRALLASR